MKKMLSVFFAVGISLVVVAPTAGDAKAGDARDKYSKAQQKALYEKALKLCRSKYGGVVGVRVDYKRNVAWCRYYY
jgi:hypothetical protein